MSIYDGKLSIPPAPGEDGTVAGGRYYDYDLGAWRKSGNKNFKGDVEFHGDAEFMRIPFLPDEAPTENLHATSYQFVESRIQDAKEHAESEASSALQQANTETEQQVVSLRNTLSDILFADEGDIGDNNIPGDVGEDGLYRDLRNFAVSQREQAEGYTDTEITSAKDTLRDEISSDIDDALDNYTNTVIDTSGEFPTSLNDDETVYGEIIAQRDQVLQSVSDIEEDVQNLEANLEDLSQEITELDDESAVIEFTPRLIGSNKEFTPSILGVIDFSQSEIPESITQVFSELTNNESPLDETKEGFQGTWLDDMEGAAEESEFWISFDPDSMESIFDRPSDEYLTIKTYDAEIQLAKDDNDDGNGNDLLLSSNEDSRRGIINTPLARGSLFSNISLSVGIHSGIISTFRSFTKYEHSLILASKRVRATDPYEVVLGYGEANTEGENDEDIPLESNIHIRLNSQYGTIWTYGSITIDGDVSEDNHATTKTYVDTNIGNATANSDNWDTAYDRSITDASVAGDGNSTFDLTLTSEDSNTVTASVDLAHTHEYDDLPSDIATDSDVDGVQSNLDTHINDTGNVHGATSAATADQLIVRDIDGRAQVADPDDSADIATRGWVETWVGNELDDYVTQSSLDSALGEYATEDWVENTALDGYATEDWVNTQLDSYVTQTSLDTTLEDYATEDWVTNTALDGYATESYVDSAVGDIIEDVRGVVTTTSDLTVDDATNVVLTDADAENVTITLDTSNTPEGLVVYVKKIDTSANEVTITSTQDIDGSPDDQIIDTENETLRFVNDGAAWFIV